MGWGASSTTAITPAWGKDSSQQSTGAERKSTTKVQAPNVSHLTCDQADWNTGVTSGAGVTDEWVEKTIDSTTGDSISSTLEYPV